MACRFIADASISAFSAARVLADRSRNGPMGWPLVWGDRLQSRLVEPGDRYLVTVPPRKCGIRYASENPDRDLGRYNVAVQLLVAIPLTVD